VANEVTRRVRAVTRVLRISGTVQGVGYRAALCRIARGHGVAGWVRNRSDNTVEALVQGAPDAVEEVIQWAKTGPPAARVLHVQVDTVTEFAAGTHAKFEWAATE